MRADVERAVNLLREKRPDSVERALEMLQRTVFAFSMRVCGHREDAEDTMQDVLIKSMPHLPAFDNPKALAVWLYTVAKNRCLMGRRRSKFAPKQELSLDELMPDGAELERLGSEHPEKSLLRQENSEFVRNAVLKIPPQYRLILVLHDMEELDTGEVARITGLRPGTVRVRLHRARLFLRRELTKAESASHPRRRTQPERGAQCKRMFAALSDYLDGELPAENCADIRRHMADCKPCLAFLDDLERTVKGVAQVPAAKPDPQLAAEMRKRILHGHAARTAGARR